MVRPFKIATVKIIILNFSYDSTKYDISHLWHEKRLTFRILSFTFLERLNNQGEGVSFVFSRLLTDWNYEAALGVCVFSVTILFQFPRSGTTVGFIKMRNVRTVFDA